MIKKLLLLCLLCLTILSISAQDYDQDYFRSPVQHKMRLSGSFAELRTNHFHMGIDIKSSRGRSGDPIFAAADGFISRINVDASGYGNAVYIDHDNGYTTVYAHLSAFQDTLSQYIKKAQHKTNLFQQQLYPDSLFFVQKGETIGYMGNTGKSFGPHLHFEIRETKSETPVNPFLFGLKPTDNRPPVFEAIKFYKSDTLGNILELLERKVKIKSKGIYTIGDDIIKAPADQIAISVQVYDQMDGAYNKNGVYLMKMLVNDKVQHGYKLDRVSYDETHFINSFIDYKEKKESKKQFSNCFTHPVDKLSIYQHKPDRKGRILLSKGKATDVKIVLQDFHGNESVLSFKVQSSPILDSATIPNGNYALRLNEKNIVRLNNADLIFEDGTFLNDQLLNISEGKEKVDDLTLPNFNIGKKEIPLFKNYKLLIKELSIVDSLRTHFCLLQCDEDTKTSIKGEWKDSLYVAELNTLGEFQCSLDKTPPTIKAINLKRDMSTQSAIKFKITDNYEAASKVDRLKYRGEIDGNWVLFEYDLKNDLIFYKFDNNCPPGEHILNLTVNDNRGNESTFSYQFTKF